MNKHQLLKYFQRKHLLTPSHKTYAQNISQLFLWLTKSDKVRSDHTSNLLEIKKSHTAKIIAHEPCTLAGLEELSFLLKKNSNLAFNPQMQDGDNVKKHQVVAKLTGDGKEILSLERSILNILQRLSGIATQTKKIIDLGRSVNPRIEIAVTRKTPWMLLDKKAVAVGGGLTHRLDLGDGILIKDNHLKLLDPENKINAIRNALEFVWKKNSSYFLEIEVENTKEAMTVLSTRKKINPGVPIAIMLDNFKVAQIEKTVKDAKNSFDTSLVLFEASGGINEYNIKEFAKSGVDFLSIGSLTHSPKAVDFSLEL